MNLIKVHMHFIMAADPVAPDVPSVTLTQEIGIEAKAIEALAWDGCFLLALLLRVRHCNTICCCF